MKSGNTRLKIWVLENEGEWSESGNKELRPLTPPPGPLEEGWRGNTLLERAPEEAGIC